MRSKNHDGIKLVEERLEIRLVVWVEGTGGMHGIDLKKKKKGQEGVRGWKREDRGR